MHDVSQLLQSALADQKAGRPTDARHKLESILQREPANTEALRLLGLVHFANCDNAAAIMYLQQAVDSLPDEPVLYQELGDLHHSAGDLDRAIECYRTAVKLDPTFAVAFNNLGAALDKQQDLPAAVAAYQSAVDLEPDRIEMLKNLAAALWRNGEADESVKRWEQVLQIDSTDAEAHVAIAASLLAAGDFERGWVEYEWRWRVPSAQSDKRSFSQRPWDGTDPAGKTILVFSEQGLGDTIQFVRYLPLLASRGANVVFECQPELATLLSGVPGASTVIFRGQPLPDFDLHVPLLSLPRMMGTTLATIPAGVPYITPDPQTVGRWKQRIRELTASQPSALKVGLVWAGRADNPRDRRRSIPLPMLAPLAQIPIVVLFSLQKGSGAEQLATSPFPIIDLAIELTDFAQTAAAMASLDVVVSIDTAAAHLAGAIGADARTLLPEGGDWRWLRGRSDSPWYPTMRLYRQTRAGQWGDVIDRVAADLRTRATSAKVGATR